MPYLQFRVLYRQFLFRMVDLELLSPDAQGDTNKLLGQLAALLIFFSAGLGLLGLLLDQKGMTPAQFEVVIWSMEHLLIATTMLIVGLFAVLSWDSTFPERRDVLVLGPLPVRTRTLFLARIAAVATGLIVAVGVLNVGPGYSLPVTLSSVNPGLLDMLLPFAHRSFFAYWITMFAAGAFLFCCVLSVQGLAALLPRRIFLRLSSFLQVTAFCLFVSVYFLQPSLTTPPALADPRNQPILRWLPSYWFLGLLQQLNGSLSPITARLAQRAWLGLAIAVTVTALAYALSYFRTLRKVVEEPDIIPGAPLLNWSPRFGTALQTAIVLFSIRALSRSRRHRVILAFYLGIGLAFVIALSKTSMAYRHLSTFADVQSLISSFVLLCFWIVGARLVFAMPLDPRANWIFRMMPLHGGSECLSAARRSLYLLSWLPFFAASALWFLSIWPAKPALGHLAILGLLGMILVDLSLYDYQKIPFTCTWLPGKSNVHMVFVGVLFLFRDFLFKAGELELHALRDLTEYRVAITVLALAAGAARWRTSARATGEEPVVQFDEEQPPAIMSLGLFRDGMLPPQAGR